jgi:hypothetical protein
MENFQCTVAEAVEANVSRMCQPFLGGENREGRERQEVMLNFRASTFLKKLAQ